MSRTINMHVVHCSVSLYGNKDLIWKLHTGWGDEIFQPWDVKGFGWSDIGYHNVICNEFPTRESFDNKTPMLTHVGLLERGRPYDQKGAHAIEVNANSIGTCLIGDRQFHCNQLLRLYTLHKELEVQFGPLKLVGHYEVTESSKTCPNINMNWLQGWFEGYQIPQPVGRELRHARSTS